MKLAGPGGNGTTVKPEPGILAQLRAGHVKEACEIAARRLRASGFVPLASFLSDGSRRNIDWSAGAIAPERLLASLLFPISDRAVNILANRVLRLPRAETLV